MIQVNAMGDACPVPVVKTLQALKELKGAGTGRGDSDLRHLPKPLRTDRTAAGR